MPHETEYLLISMGWFDSIPWFGKSFTWLVLLYQIKSNILVKHNGTVERLKPCKIRVEGAWKSGKGREQGKPCWVQESLESVKRGRMDYFHREGIPRDLIQPKLNPSHVTRIKQCNQLKGTYQSEFNFALTESSSSKNQCILFISFWTHGV